MKPFTFSSFFLKKNHFLYFGRIQRKDKKKGSMELVALLNAEKQNDMYVRRERKRNVIQKDMGLYPKFFFETSNRACIDIDVKFVT